MIERPALHTPRPRWLSLRTLLPIGGLAIATFFLPQAVPLQWYPLNHQDDDAHYLAVRLASDRTGDIALDYRVATDAPAQWRSIRIPLSPIEEPLTYTFPLPDAPLAAVRLQGLPIGTLHLLDFLVTDRRGRPVMHLDPTRFRQTLGGTLTAGVEDWALRSDATGPATIEYDLPLPLLPKKTVARNAQRCARSFGYLSGMAALLLGAVVVALRRPRLAEIFPLAGYVAVVALLVSAVGNRGLLRETIRIARYSPPPSLPGLVLEVELDASAPSPAQLFWDRGRGINQEDSARANITTAAARQVLRFPLPRSPLHLLRYDPCDDAGLVRVRSIRLVDTAGVTRCTLSPRTLLPGQHVRCEPIPTDEATVQIVCTGADPSTWFSAAALDLVNQALATAR